MTETTTLTVRGTQQIDEMDRTLIAVEPSKLAQMPLMRRALTVAAGIQKLRELLVGDMLSDVMQLQGTVLGFRTDKDDKGGYPAEVVRDCCIAAAMKGARLCGNEFNIIASREYLTKAFFERAIAEFDGLANLKLTEGVPVGKDSGALVPYSATWELNGSSDAINCQLTEAGDTRIPVRVNKGMGADAILGKAKRKMLAKIYCRITGSQMAEYVADENTVDSEAVVISEPESPNEIDEGPWIHERREEVAEELSRAVQVSEVDAILNEFLSWCGSEAEAQMDWCHDKSEMHHKRIRSARGEKSNV